MRELLRFNEEGAEEVGEHPLGVVLVTVETDDAEVGGADLLHPRVEVAFGLVQGGGLRSGLGTTLSGTGHDDGLPRTR
jgi:hypothetical protein